MSDSRFWVRHYGHTSIHFSLSTCSVTGLENSEQTAFCEIPTTQDAYTCTRWNYTVMHINEMERKGMSKWIIQWSSFRPDEIIHYSMWECELTSDWQTSMQLTIILQQAMRWTLSWIYMESTPLNLNLKTNGTLTHITPLVGLSRRMIHYTIVMQLPMWPPARTALFAMFFWWSLMPRLGMTRSYGAH